MLIYILGATVLVSLISLVSVTFLAIKKTLLNELISYFIALSAGTMIGAAFLHLLPESAEFLDLESVFITVLGAFIAFFAIERLIHWHHCHITGEHEHHHTIGYMNLIADALHNFIDGFVIAAAFMANIQLGLVTSLAVVLHEIPQEIGDFGVLIYSGWKKKAAILANISVSVTMVLGGILGYLLANQISEIVPYITAFAAGGFIYIAAADLMPELREEQNVRKSFVYLGVFILGIALTYFLGE